MKALKIQYETITEITDRQGCKSVATFNTLQDAIDHCNMNMFNVHTIKVVYTVELFKGSIKVLRFTLNK